ncbi:ABC transporter permease [Mesorhizobium sp. IMUNJ 23232]|uniref:ABC transporter permease n=1 Tax=Mesorhizobium sp. IMUNJ 23232 TaxID=3376064 RepID=UPI0037AE9E6A
MRLSSLVWTLMLGLFVLFMLGPLVLVVMFSFNSSALVSLPLTGLTLDWYRRLADTPEFWSALQNSLAIAVPVAILSTVTGTLAAMALTQWRSRLAMPLLTGLSVPVMIPPRVVAIGLVVLLVRWLQMPLGLPAVVGGHVLLAQPFVALIIAARMATFDYTCVEAARDLGASPWQIFRKVTLPQISAAIVGAALIAFALSLDEFIVTVFTIGSGNTLSTFVWGKMRTALDPSINAIATVILVITIGCAALALRMTRYRG